MQILAIDVGGTGLKAAVLDSEGNMLSERVRVETPHPCGPQLLVDALVKLVEPLADYERVSVGFPGVVRRGRVITAPNLGTKAFRGLDLAAALEGRLGKPVRVLNDADMQGLGAVEGAGVEMVVTLGTGFGSAIFVDGRLGPHLELSHHPFRKGETYDEQLGNAALKKIGKAKWNRRVKLAIETLRSLTNFDRLYIGGGNAKRIDFDLGPDVRTVPNEYGIKGGARLWQLQE
ncbi:MAG TPA: ROK family protein [Pyrinomonadaceae bacterium]|nr:ROK family protein [Pyrinomonadaceae bacterium]